MESLALIAKINNGRVQVLEAKQRCVWADHSLVSTAQGGATRHFPACTCLTEA